MPIIITRNRKEIKYGENHPTIYQGYKCIRCRSSPQVICADAVIDDVSVGEKFKSASGVRKYLEKFFVGYNTVTKLESVAVFDNQNAKAQVDFTGEFGHETGGLDFTLNSDGLIKTINAYLD